MEIIDMEKEFGVPTSFSINPNFKIPAFAEAASRRQANVKGMSKLKTQSGRP
jgi:hypothetical protein